MPLATLALIGTALGAEPYTAETLRPYLNNEVNALELNRLFIDSMMDMDRVPLTVGTAVRASPASYLKMDGKVTEAGLGKVLYTLSLGAGQPRTGGAFFAGGIVSSVRPSDFPNIWALSGKDEDFISAAGTSAIFFAGFANQGTAVQLAYHRTELGYDADGAGRFVPGGCDPKFGCLGRVGRPGTPVPSPPVAYQRNKHALLLNVLNEHGYSSEALISSVDDVLPSGALAKRAALAAARVAGVPDTLLEPEIGQLGAGLNFYDKSMDYYGDRNEAISVAASEGETPPPTSKMPMLELPFLAQNLADLGFQARVIPQILPVPAFRMLEAGYSMEGTLGEPLVPQVGTRAKVFKRAKGYEPSLDAYAGLLISYGDLSDEVARGVSVMASYSYNSPDSLTFVPVPNTHVLGIQVIVGNATALPPPVAILRENSDG